MDVLEVSHLTKRFGSFVAVDDVSFSLREGEILGLLGPNGAGKTTTIQMLLGVLAPTGGEVSYFGKKFSVHREEILEQVNFSSTYTHLPWDLTVRENLTFIAYLYAIPDRRRRLEKVADIFRIRDLLSRTMNQLSEGQLTRVNLAKAFINFPKVLLLDEPTASLDPDVARYIRDFLLRQRHDFQVSIIITSHNMAEVEEVCDRVVFIDKGKIIADDTPAELARSIEICHVELFIRDGLKRITEYCRAHELIHRLEGRYIIVDLTEHAIPDFLRDLMGQGILYDEISIEKPTLEDYFLAVVRKESVQKL